MNNKLIPLLFAFMWFVSTSFFAPDNFMQTAEMTREIANAIGKGNARDVAKHFGNTVDLKIPGNEGTFSRNQAELILRNFFTRQVPESFNIEHQGPSRDGSVYVIGVYTDKNGKTYRTYFLLKKISDQMVLNLLQMDEQ